MQAGRGRGVEACGVGAGLLFTWCADSIVVGGMVGTNGPHEAEHAAAEHGGQEGVKCSVEEEDEAWGGGEEEPCHRHEERQRDVESLQQSGGGRRRPAIGLQQPSTAIYPNTP